MEVLIYMKFHFVKEIYFTKTKLQQSRFNFLQSYIIFIVTIREI